MDFWLGFGLITSIHLMGAMSPGPDFVMVTQHTLRYGKRAGLLCSAGIALGLSVHIIYSVLGLAAIVANSVYALWLIKIIAGCYLMFLGWQGLRARRTTVETLIPAEHSLPSGRKSIVLGFFCNALNPKAPIYFVALFTLVLSPQMPIHQLAIYGVWMMILQLGWFSAVVLVLSQPRITQKFNRGTHWVDRVFGTLMLLLGLKLLWSALTSDVSAG